MAGVDAWKSFTQDETLVESAWERQMRMDGAELFDERKRSESGEDRGASNAQSGQKVLRQLLKLSTKSIETLQKAVFKVNRVERSWKATIMMISTDALALIALRVMLDRAYGSSEADAGFSYQAAAKQIGRLVQQEVNFITWVKSSRAAARTYAKAEGLKGVPASFADQLIEEEGMNSRSIRNWKKTFAELSTYDWENKELQYCGDALMQTIVEACPEQFEIFYRKTQNTQQKCIRLAPEFKEEFDKMESQISKLQVVKRPMLSKPERWTRV